MLCPPRTQKDAPRSLSSVSELSQLQESSTVFEAIPVFATVLPGSIAIAGDFCAITMRHKVALTGLDGVEPGVPWHGT